MLSSSHKYALNYQLPDNVLQRDYDGTFETHITVTAADIVTRQKFRQVCQDLGVKCVLIELPNGMMRSQPMTASYHRGSLTAVLTQIQALAQQLIKAGFPVTRVKVEAMMSNKDIPVQDNEALSLPATHYFEFHVLVTLPATIDVAAFQSQCALRDAHLSANAFKHAAEGQQQRFVTMRCYGIGKKSALARFDALLQWLKAQELECSQPQREYVLYDTNVSLDAGWLNIPSYQEAIP